MGVLTSKKVKITSWTEYILTHYRGVFCLVFLLPLANNYTLMTAFVLLNAFAFGGQFLMDSTLADVIDYDQMLYGERLDGIFASTAYFVPKAVGAFASALPLTIIYSVGFVEPLKGCPGANETAAMAAMAEMKLVRTAADASFTADAKSILNRVAACGRTSRPRRIHKMMTTVANHDPSHAPSVGAGDDDWACRPTHRQRIDDGGLQSSCTIVFFRRFRRRLFFFFPSFHSRPNP